MAMIRNDSESKELRLEDKLTEIVSVEMLGVDPFPPFPITLKGFLHTYFQPIRSTLDGVRSFLLALSCAFGTMPAIHIMVIHSSPRYLL